MTHWAQAEPFTFQTATDFNQVKIWAFTQSGGKFSNFIDYTIYGGSGIGGPSGTGVLAHGQVAAQQGTGAGASDYSLTFSLISNFSADANTTYWLTLVNGGNAVDWEEGSGIAIGQEQAGSLVSTDQVWSWSPTGTWQSSSYGHPFILSYTPPTPDSGSVPLPSALLLFGPGLAGIALIRRRFRK